MSLIQFSLRGCNSPSGWAYCIGLFTLLAVLLRRGNLRLKRGFRMTDPTIAEILRPSGYATAIGDVLPVFALLSREAHPVRL
jgi:hypothetical protein